MPSLNEYYTLEYVSPSPGDLHYEEGVEPDLRYNRFCDINPDDLANIDAYHVLIDLDGTLVPTKSPDLAMPKLHAVTFTAILHDSRFKTVSVATENGTRVNRIRRALGEETLRVFSSYYNLNDDEGLKTRRWKEYPEFWRYILYNLDMLDTPEEVVMIGDSLVRDIKPAQDAGLKTVQVDRLERHLLPFEDILKLREGLTT